MGLAHSPSIVRDGISLYHDLGNTRRSYSPNVHSSSTNIYDWYVGIRGNANGNNCTFAKDTITSPVGNTPLRMDITGNDPHMGSYANNNWNLNEASQGETWTVSVYAKASIEMQCQIFIFGTPSSGGYVEAPAGTINLTTDWRRISYTYTFTNANTEFIQSRLDGPDSATAGESIWFDGWQVERGSTPSNFTSDYTSGDILDIFGSSNTGSIVSTPQYSNEYGGSLIFDGTDDYIQFPSTTISRNGGAFSIWFYVDDFSAFTAGKTVNSRILVRGDNDFQRLIAVYEGGFGYETNTNSDPNDVADNTIPDWTATEITSGKWVNLAMSNKNSQSTFYINGVFNRTLDVDDDLQLAYIGRGQSPTNYPDFLKGRVSNFKIYNRALTASEVKQNFDALRGRYGV